jgi:glycolate oxidase iron-sulfur subunit
MQTTLSGALRTTPEGEVAERILRSCVHCGFCLATCPTYQILGNELDSPRGRIYLIKQVFEGHAATAKTQLHLDRCLTCRSCETTCPSGVEYGKLLDIGRALVEAQVGRTRLDRLQRRILKTLIPNPRLFTPLLKLGRRVRPFMPGALKAKIPAPAAKSLPEPPATQHPRKMLLLEGCAQPALAPGINTAATRVLDRLGVTLFAAPAAGCCGAVTHHLNDRAGGLDAMRRNIDAWLPHLDAGAETIVMTASGCGVTVKEYGWHLRHDPAYADKAARISAATKDLSEVLLAESEKLGALPSSHAAHRKVAFHSPCTLQHGQKITGVVEALLTRSGFELTTVPESHLCCGSAGTYSILQPAIADALKTRKLGHLQTGQPEMIVTANIGCLTHLQSGSPIPVRHWVELLDDVTGKPKKSS